MAYTPTVWKTGDVITAEQLNKAENGIAAANPFIVHMSWEGSTATLDASYDDITGKKGSVVFAQEDFLDDPSEPSLTNYYLASCYVSSETYYAVFIGCDPGESSVSVMVFEAASSDAPLAYTVV